MWSMTMTRRRTGRQSRVDRPRQLHAICLDTYIPFNAYFAHGVGLRNHRRAKPPRDPEPAGVVRAVCRRDRTSPSNGAADRLEAPARPARGGVRGITDGSPAAAVSSEPRAAHGT